MGKVTKGLSIWILICLCLPIALAEIYSENGIIYNEINAPAFPQLTYQSLFSKEFIYFINPTERADEYLIRICHNDFDSTKGIESLKEYRIISPNIDATLNLADNECQETTGIIKIGEKADFDKELTIIREPVSILLSLPEKTDCQTDCRTEITIKNIGNAQLNFDEMAMQAEIADGSVTSLSMGLGKVITLYPDESASYQLIAQAPHTTPYNIIFWIDGKAYETAATFSVQEIPRPSNEIYRANGNIYLPIDTEPIPIITSETGIQREFTYDFTKTASGYEIEVCHKDYAANKDAPSIASMELTTIDASKTNLATIDLKSNPCQTINAQIDVGEAVKLGAESTIITIDNANVTFSVEPEYTECGGLSCTNQIILENRGETPITIESDHISISSSSATSLKTFTDDGRDISDSFPITIQPDSQQTFILLADFATFGEHKYNVSLLLNGTEYTIDPYYHTTNTTPPRAEWNNPTAQSYLQNTTINLTADALDYYNISQVRMQIEYPNGVKVNITPSTEPIYWTLLNENESTGTFTNNFATFFGDFSTSYVTIGKFLINKPTATNFNRVAVEMNSISGNPNLQNFIYNITICETNVSALITSASRTQDCTSPVVNVGENVHLSNQIGTLNLNNFALLKLNKNFTMNVSKSYIVSFDYVSSDINFASDFWTLRTQAFTFPNVHYGRVVNTSATFFSNLLGNIKLFSDFTSTFTNTTQVGRYNFTLFATDFHGNINGTSTFYFNIFANCTPNWTGNYSTCNTSDFRACLNAYDTNSCGIAYTGNLSEFPPIPCNYCSESLSQIFGNCLFNGTGYSQNTSWIDTNYLSCCAITGLVSDCSILYTPYNESAMQQCTGLSQDFDVQYDANCDLGLAQTDKCYWQVSINNTATDYRCTSYVLTTDGNLIQSNPPYIKKSSSLIQWTGSQYEDREYFSALNGLGQVYFTKENLIFDGRTYIFGAQCNSANQSLKSERLVQVGYENLNAPATRFFWGINNITWGIMAVLMFIVAVLIVGWVIHRWQN